MCFNFVRGTSKIKLNDSPNQKALDPEILKAKISTSTVFTVMYQKYVTLLEEKLNCPFPIALFVISRCSTCLESFFKAAKCALY